MKKITNASVIVGNTQVIAAMQKYVTSKTEIPIGGEMVKPAAVVATFQKSLDTRSSAVAAHGAYKAALVDRDAAETARATFDDGLKAWVLNRFGVDSAEAHEFGYSARKTAVVSAATRATAVLQNAATREARGTVGRKKKLKIKGTLVVPTAPAAPAVNAAPAVAPAPVAPAAKVVVSAPATAPATTAPAAVPAVNGAGGTA